MVAWTSRLTCLQNIRWSTICTHKFGLCRSFICAEISRQRRQHQDIYLFVTCASTRAIHLELIRGLNVDSFLLAFQRFVGRRGLPATLLSDNATTFRSSSKEIQSICHSPEVFCNLTKKQTSWRFIAPKARWWEGFWERMVQTVKCSLRKVVGRAVLRFNELNTLLIDTESNINGWSLTYVCFSWFWGDQLSSHSSWFALWTLTGHFSKCNSLWDH